MEAHSRPEDLKTDKKFKESLNKKRDRSLVRNKCSDLSFSNLKNYGFIADLLTHLTIWQILSDDAAATNNNLWLLEFLKQSKCSLKNLQMLKKGYDLNVFLFIIKN